MENDAVLKLNKDQHSNLLKYVTTVYMFIGGNDLNLRAALEWRDRVYYRETDWTKSQLQARWANYWGDAKKLQNMVVPVVQPQIEQAVGYLTEVFCTGEPFFGVFSPPPFADAAGQMESVIADNSRRFGWRGEFIKYFRDGLKYNFMGLEMAWENKKVFSVINDPTTSLRDAASRAEEMYAGNRAKRIDPYNIIIDTRVPPNEVHRRGEFVGYVQLMPRTELKQLIIDLGSGNTMNVTEAFKSNCNAYVVGNATPGQYYIPLINPGALINQSQNIGTNWLSWISGVTKNGAIEYKDLYEVAIIYGRFMPSDFNLSLTAKNTPQIFKMIVVNKQWIIFMQRMTNAHNFLPIVVGQPFDDGLGYQAKGYGDNVTPYQEMSSALWNAGIAGKRKEVFDRIFYDPSRINKTDIDKVSEVARIPVKAAAYGKPVTEAFAIAPYRAENTIGVLEMATRVQQMAQIANGTNNVQQGQFQKGNKTRVEFETVMNQSNWRPRLFAITLEDTVFEPIKEIVKMNIVQYQGPAELYSQEMQQAVKIDPQTLRRATFTFKLTDGQTPTEKLLNPELIGQVFQLGMAVPQLNAEYDIMGLLMYSLKMQGAHWITQFKRTPEQMQQYLQATAAATTAQAEPKNRETPSETANNSPQPAAGAAP